MKAKKISKKIQINKETVANLDESQLKDVKGGIHINESFVPETCQSICYNCQGAVAEKPSESGNCPGSA